MLQMIVLCTLEIYSEWYAHFFSSHTEINPFTTCIPYHIMHDVLYKWYLLDLISVSRIPKRKPLPKIVSSLLSDKEMRKKLREHGLSSQGNRQVRDTWLPWKSNPDPEGDQTSRDANCSVFAVYVPFFSLWIQQYVFCMFWYVSLLFLIFFLVTIIVKLFLHHDILWT